MAAAKRAARVVMRMSDLPVSRRGGARDWQALIDQACKTANGKKRAGLHVLAFQSKSSAGRAVRQLEAQVGDGAVDMKGWTAIAVVQGRGSGLWLQK